MLQQKPLLLIDLDGVAKDYYGRFLEVWKERYPDRKVLAPHELKTFYIEDSYGQEYAKDITDITREVGFFENLQPLPGAVEAMHDIMTCGEFDPFICSSPDIDVIDQACFTEKARSVEKHFGREWLKRMILTKDKTMIIGDYLIDDKPEITGKVEFPLWEHIVFTHEYNRHLSTPLRINNWGEWPKLKKEILNHWNGILSVLTPIL